VGKIATRKLYHGDCLDIMTGIPDNSIDMILCDPPYGTTACKWDAAIPFEPMWKEIKRVRKDRAAVALFGSEPFSSYLRMSNISEYKYDWYWNKGQGLNFVTAKHRPLNDTENILIFGKTLNYYPIMTETKKENIRPINRGSSKTSLISGIKSGIAKSSENYDNKKNYPVTSININSRIAECNSLNRIHPTQKPVSLLEYLIKTYTLENETVLDFTMGSGSTGVACIETNRNFIGIEKDENYFDIAVERIREEESQGRLCYA
jgi:site-specific DNA-methyltransferase (adenine-specific)